MVAELCIDMYRENIWKKISNSEQSFEPDCILFTPSLPCPKMHGDTPRSGQQIADFCSF